jgi:hypothetical protein
VVVQSIPFGFDHDRTISACVRSVLNLDIPAIPSAPRGFGRRGVFRFAIAPLNTMCIQRRLDFGGLCLSEIKLAHADDEVRQEMA